MLFGGTCILLAVIAIPHSLLSPFAFITLSGRWRLRPDGRILGHTHETCRPKSSIGDGFVNLSANLGAYFAPLFVGYLNKTTAVSWPIHLPGRDHVGGRRTRRTVKNSSSECQT